MEQKQITMEKLYEMMKSIQRELSLELHQINEKLGRGDKGFEDWNGDERFLADEELLGECWNSKEDEEAFAYLQ